MFWALLRADVNPLLTAQAKMILAWAKMSLSQAITINSIVLF